MAGGLLTSIVLGRVLVNGVDRLPARRRRTAEWLLIAGVASLAIGASVILRGPWGVRAFALIVATAPGILAYVVWRTMLASAVVALVPLYFAIGALTPGRALHQPLTAIDAAMPFRPAWMFVYASLFPFVLLPVFVVRERGLVRRTLQACLAVMIVGYAGFVLYPTVGPRPAAVPGAGFAEWYTRLIFSLDWRYNCFPSLHVAYSFVAALSVYCVHKSAGIGAVVWASLIAVSTVYTKQHYAVDTIAGATMGVAAYFAFLRAYPRDRSPEVDRRLAPRRALAAAAVYGVAVAGLWLAYRAGVPSG